MSSELFLMLFGIFIFIIISWVSIRLIIPRKEEYFDYTKPKLIPWKPIGMKKENLFDDGLFDNEFNRE